MHHPDLTPGVLAGLAWYYLLAAMMNAAAAAYVAYMEMVSEGASREGLAPRRRRLPDWMVIGFLGLYGLATLLVLFRGSLPNALTVAYCLCAVANMMVAVGSGADAAVGLPGVTMREEARILPFPRKPGTPGGRVGTVDGQG